jgi:DNA-binding MarR family transcriptional regulator
VRVSSPRLPFDPIAEARRHWEAHGWREAAPGMTAVTSLVRAQQIMLARVDGVLKPYGLTFARYEVLMLLLFSRSGSLPMKKISARLQVHPTSVTNAVDRLHAAGLILSRPDPDDGRSRLVRLSAKGRRTAIAATADLNTQVFANPGLSDKNLVTLVGILEDMRKQAGDF